MELLMKTFLEYLAEAEQVDLSPEEQSEKEGSEKTIHPDHDAVHTGDIYRARDVGGYDRVYHMNRMMMAMAKADGKSTKAVDSPAETWFEKNNTMHPYTKEESNMVKSAMNTVPTDGKMVSHDNKSREPNDVNRTSPHRNPGPITRKR
jgi:hypothetical protein